MVGMGFRLLPGVQAVARGFRLWPGVWRQWFGFGVVVGVFGGVAGVLRLFQEIWLYINYQFRGA